MNYKTIKTLKGACKSLGINPDKLTTKQDSENDAAFKQLKPFVRALNAAAAGKEYKPDWKNADERKNQLLWDLSHGGFVLHYVPDFYQFSYVPSCLCFVSREVAEYAAGLNEFKKLYKKYMLTL